LIGLKHKFFQIAHLTAIICLFLHLFLFLMILVMIGLIRSTIELVATPICTFYIFGQIMNVLLILFKLTSIIFSTIYSRCVLIKIYLGHSAIFCIFLKISKISRTRRVIRLYIKQKILILYKLLCKDVSSAED
jgi:hypothetical protein